MKPAGMLRRRTPPQLFSNTLQVNGIIGKTLHVNIDRYARERDR
jgi:hypothetical protein